MKSAKAFVADSTHRADSLKAHPPAKAPAADKHASTTPAPIAESVPMTPADSIRALEASRAAARGEGVADTSHAAKPATSHDASGKPATDKPVAAVAGTKTPAPVPPPAISATADLAAMVRAARHEAMTTALPEQRLAKIFSAMSPKDAAKVLEQMPDADVRTILALMSDRSAAAVLTQFPPARAATITNGPSRAPVKAAEKPSDKPSDQPSDKPSNKPSDKQSNQTPDKTP
jgi:hypothetical protein